MTQSKSPSFIMVASERRAQGNTTIASLCASLLLPTCIPIVSGTIGEHKSENPSRGSKELVIKRGATEAQVPSIIAALEGRSFVLDTPAGILSSSASVTSMLPVLMEHAMLAGYEVAVLLPIASGDTAALPRRLLQHEALANVRKIVVRNDINGLGQSPEMTDATPTVSFGYVAPGLRELIAGDGDGFFLTALRHRNEYVTAGLIVWNIIKEFVDGMTALGLFDFARKFFGIESLCRDLEAFDHQKIVTLDDVRDEALQLNAARLALHKIIDVLDRDACRSANIALREMLKSANC